MDIGDLTGFQSDFHRLLRNIGSKRDFRNVLAAYADDDLVATLAPTCSG